VTADPLRPELRWAIEAAQGKQAAAITLLDMSGLSAFTDAFLLCTGFSTPQVAAIAEAVEEKLRPHGLRPLHREGRHGAEWVLLDYGRFIVHIFTERQRLYYDLERLWRAARRIEITESQTGVSADRSGLYSHPGLQDGSELHSQPGLKKRHGS
jgi:ribosome-associated protein